MSKASDQELSVYYEENINSCIPDNFDYLFDYGFGSTNEEDELDEL